MDREEIQAFLKQLIGSDNVYFQPPVSIVMRYPCIVYNRTKVKVKRANGLAYGYDIAYTVTLISKDPDDTIFSKLVELPKSSFDRHFTAEQLNHDIFTIFF